MFESAEITIPIEKNEYNNILPELRLELFNCQQQLIDAKIPTLIIISGVAGSGRGEIVNLLNEWMDSRHLNNVTFWLPTDEEKDRPEYWRYWRVLPKKGEMTIFFSGWYEAPYKQLFGGEIDIKEFQLKFQRVASLERLLTEDGMLIIKIWLHLSEKDQKKILKKKKEEGDHNIFDTLKKEPEHDSYPEYIDAVSKAIRITDQSYAPWYQINSADKRQRNISVIKTIIDATNSAIKAKKTDKSKHTTAMPVTSKLSGMILDNVDLTKSISQKKYQEELDQYQELLQKLSIKAFEKNINTVILFEGWDSAGKGGAIRRLTPAIDARIRHTISIAAPTDEELSHHYLWRFWRHLPRNGFFTIYDRSWYGRVLVERVEKYATVEEWSRAYSEINEFEDTLVSGGVLLLKFWLHISPEEQLKRFKERENDPLKNYKLTDEDWKNRAKYSQYMEAINDMFIRTSTDVAPWHIIPAENKHYARIEVIKEVCHALEKKLDKIKKNNK